MNINGLEQYEFHEIASGCLCDTYHARHIGDRLPDLTIKIMNETTSLDPILRLRFYDETTYLRSLCHNQIPRLVKTGVYNGRPYSACHYIHGVSLRDAITSNAINPYRIPDLTAQLLRVVWYLHNRLEPVVHSDISPENIMLDKQNRLYLIDFGCAQSIRANSSGASCWVAKPAYMSPEQARGMPWNQRSDLYQTGLIIYELYTGKKRNSGMTAKEMIPLASEPNPLLLDNIPGKMSDILSGLLTTEAALRGSTAKDYIDMLYSNNLVHNSHSRSRKIS